MSEIITKKGAVKDVVLGPFINAADDELAFTGRFRFAPLIKQLGMKAHRQFIHAKMHVVRRVLEDKYGPLTPIGTEDGCAGKGRGNHTVGYVRAIDKFSDIVDESLTRKQGLAVGIRSAHNNLAEIISDETGEGRPVMDVDISLIGKEPAEEPRQLPAPSPATTSDNGVSPEAREFARQALKAMFSALGDGDSNGAAKS
jgi:hypothetical protein